MNQKTPYSGVPAFAPHNPAGAGRLAVYYELIAKKALKILPRFVLTLAVTVLLFLLSMTAMARVMHQKEILPKVQIAVVSSGNDITTRLAAQLVAEMDSVKSICRFQYLTKKEAEQALADESIQAAIYLTDNIYDDINTGQNTPVVIRVSQKSGLGIRMFQDLVSVGLSMVQIGESAVYAVEETGYQYKTKIAVSRIMDQLVLDYLTLAKDRDGSWTETVLSAYGDLSLTGFYTMTVILAVLCLLVGSGFSSLYDKKEKSVDSCLSRIGIGIAHRTTARLLSMTGILWALLALSLSILARFTEICDFRGSMLLSCLPLAFSVAAFIHMINALSPGESGSLFYLLISILLFVVGGGLFPASMLPAILQKISLVLPIRLWQTYLSGFLWNGSSAKVFSVAAAGILMTLIGSIGTKIHEIKS